MIERSKGLHDSANAGIGMETLREFVKDRPRRVLSGERRAAVAAIFRDGPAGLEVLLIHRAEDERDPWSGHMAFPGGRVDGDDSSSMAAAIRETEEEVGIGLERQARLLGRLSDVTAVAHGRRLGLVIESFVFEMIAPVDLTLNAEVQEAVWVPFEFFLDRSNRSSLSYRVVGRFYDLPCYRYRGKLIWGLTLRMLDEMAGTVAGEVFDDWPER